MNYLLLVFFLVITFATSASNGHPGKFKYKIPEFNIVSSQSIPNPLKQEECPIVAVWQESKEGMPADPEKSRPPFLRFAMWEDGRIVFNSDPNKWEHNLMIAQIPKEKVSSIKEEIYKTGVFEIQEAFHEMRQGGSFNIILVSFGHYRQYLYWSESGPCLDNNPHPSGVRFEQIWHEINNILADSIPSTAERIEQQFFTHPTCWMLGVFSLPKSTEYLDWKIDFQGEKQTRYRILRQIKTISIVNSKVSTPGKDAVMLDRVINAAFASELKKLGYNISEDEMQTDAYFYCFRAAPLGSQYHFYFILLAQNNIIWAMEIPVNEKIKARGYETAILRKVMEQFQSDVTKARK